MLLATSVLSRMARDIRYRAEVSASTYPGRRPTPVIDSDGASPRTEPRPTVGWILALASDEASVHKKRLAL